MAMQHSTLRPGLLVSLKTTITGNASYIKTTIDPEHVTDEGIQLARWETERRVADPEEYEKAKMIRGRARALITAVCAQSSFGLLCPESKAEKLELAVAEARRLVREFDGNRTRVNINIITGRVAPDDVEAVKAINSEVRDLMDRMENGLKNFDVQAVRDAATKAKSLGSMLTEGASERIKEAIEAARLAARKIKKSGEAVSAELDTMALSRITDARTAFLDLDEVNAEAVHVEAEAVEVDFSPASDVQPFEVEPVQFEVE